MNKPTTPKLVVDLLLEVRRAADTADYVVAYEFDSDAMRSIAGRLTTVLDDLRDLVEDEFDTNSEGDAR